MTSKKERKYVISKVSSKRKKDIVERTSTMKIEESLEKGVVLNIQYFSGLLKDINVLKGEITFSVQLLFNKKDR